MGLALGYKGGLFQFEEETTYGTAVTPTKVLEINSESTTKEQAHLQKTGINSLIQDKDDVAKGRTVVSGDVEFDLRYGGFEYLFKHGLGSLSSVQQGVTAAHKHTIVMADALPTGMTMEIDADTKAKQIEGGKINTISFSGEADGFIKCSVGILGEDLTMMTPTTGNTLPTEALIPFSQVEITYGGSSIDARSFNLELNNNLDAERYYLNSLTTKEPLRGGTRPEATGSLTIDFEDNTEFDAFIAQATNDIVITATGAIIEGAYAYELILTAKNCIFTGGVPSVSGIGIIPLELPFKAYATDSDTRAFSVEMQNTDSSFV